jgi:hypothetical protein
VATAFCRLLSLRRRRFLRDGFRHDGALTTLFWSIIIGRRRRRRSLLRRVVVFLVARRSAHRNSNDAFGVVFSALVTASCESCAQCGERRRRREEHLKRWIQKSSFVERFFFYEGLFRKEEGKKKRKYAPDAVASVHRTLAVTILHRI